MHRLGRLWRVYPGSRFLMHADDRTRGAAVHDRLKLFGAALRDSQALAAHVAQLEAGRQVSVARQDGFEGLNRLLPLPADPRLAPALVLIDPSYEDQDRLRLRGHCRAGRPAALATGVYLVWYPIIGRAQAHDLPRRLRTPQPGRAALAARHPGRGARRAAPHPRRCPVPSPPALASPPAACS